jgi:uncharacterized Zn finger protein
MTGNIKCETCGKEYTGLFTACPHCCQHNELELVEEWQGPDDGGGWGLAVQCMECGKNYDFRRDELIENYKLVRIQPNQP